MNVIRIKNKDINFNDNEIEQKHEERKLSWSENENEKIRIRGRRDNRKNKNNENNKNTVEDIEKEQEYMMEKGIVRSSRASTMVYTSSNFGELLNKLRRRKEELVKFNKQLKSKS